MAQPKVGGLRTVTSRADADSGGDPDLSSPPPGLAGFKHVFQSRKSALVLSLKRRRIHYNPDGSKDEVIPETKAGNRLDMIRFHDHFFKTNDDEIAEAFAALPPEVFGLGSLCWRFEDQQQAQRTARAAEIRAALAADEALAKELALSPSEKKDWDVKPKTPAAPAPAPKRAEDLTEAEMEAMTAPTPGRTR